MNHFPSATAVEEHDPDIALISSYLAGQLNAADAAKVERRLEEDAVFFDKVWPLVRVWNMPVSLRPAVLPASKARRSIKWVTGLIAAGLIVLVVQEAPRLGVHFDDSRPRLTVLAPNSLIATGPDETRELLLNDSTRVVLRPRSALTYTRARDGAASVVASVRGEAVFDVSHARSTVTVETRAGLTMLSVGRYAIRCAEGAREMLVTVERGTAMLRGIRSAIGGWLTLGSGQFGRVRDDAQPVRASGDGFPQPLTASEGGH